ncbi:hypothetical protein CHELA1G11_10619 [Hyphomicrobiales bacterium]|nr:hypothetical protein CHELA1G11_10619 [Hyphomicrobiales bacterium]CAH1673399.1 hypothetical protein CHELA1G2_13684 [Hyphomicrobiales bacterium]
MTKRIHIGGKMSRGPGRVERTIEQLLHGNSARSFTLEEIGAAVFPGTTVLEKKHRVSLLRAVRKILPSRWWGYRTANCLAC